MTGPLAADIRALRITLALAIERHRPLRIAEQRIIAARLADIEERAETLENAAFRAEVVRLRPAFAVVEGGRQC